MKTLIDKIKDAEMIADFAKHNNIPPDLISNIEITPRGDVIAPSNGKFHMLGQVDKEIEAILTNPNEIRSYVFVNHMAPYTYKENEQAPHVCRQQPNTQDNTRA